MEQTRRIQADNLVSRPQHKMAEKVFKLAVIVGVQFNDKNNSILILILSNLAEISFLILESFRRK